MYNRCIIIHNNNIIIIIRLWKGIQNIKTTPLPPQPLYHIYENTVKHPEMLSHLRHSTMVYCVVYRQ